MKKKCKEVSMKILPLLCSIVLFPFLSCDNSVTGNCWLETIDEAHGKYKLHLEGSPYNMGYYHGYLLAEKVRETTSNQFYKDIVISFIGGDPTIQEIANNETLFNLILGYMETVSHLFAVYLTEDMRQEIRGINDGARKRLQELGQDTGQISYNRLLVTNLAFDVVLTYAYPFIVKDLMNEQQQWEFNNRHPQYNPHMCDGFVATGDATTTGGTIMARSFMITPVIGDRAIIMEYVPDRGNRFVASNIPGFVGTPVAMNEHGLCIGVDMVSAQKTNPAAPGMGCLLTSRWAMQWESTVPGAMRAIRESWARGTPWLYIVADKRSGAVAEAAATTGLGWMPDQQKYFKARYMDYIFDGTNSQQACIDQIETRNDVVIATNHFIDPGLQIHSKQFAVKESVVRYDYLAQTVIEEAEYGIDIETAKELVNYLSPHPSNPYWYDVIPAPFQNEGYIHIGEWYHDDHVGGMRAVFDTENMTMQVLYRMWDDPWVVYEWDSSVTGNNNPDTSGFYKIISKHSGKAMDVSGWSTSDGANVHQWDIHGGNNQLWRLQPAIDGHYMIISKHSDKALDVYGAQTDSGANIIQWTRHGGNNQLWSLEHVGDGYFRIFAKHSGKVLDVSGKSTGNGGNIIQWHRNDGNNQLWRFEQ